MSFREELKKNVSMWVSNLLNFVTVKFVRRIYYQFDILYSNNGEKVQLT